MRAKHTSHPLKGFPVYSIAFVSANEVILGGGGGSSRAGIKNKMKLFRLDGDSSLELLSEFELEKDADAPMSMVADPKTGMFACGINSSVELIERGENKNCRAYKVDDKEIQPTGSVGTLRARDVEDYQRATSLSRDGSFLLAAGLRVFQVLRFPSLEPAAPLVEVEEDIYDAIFSPKQIILITTANITVFPLPNGNPGEPLEAIKTIPAPPMPDRGLNVQIRLHPSDENVLYTLSNSTASRAKLRSKATPRQAYISKWDVNTWKVTKIRKVSDKGATCFDISPNGKYLAFGSSDYSIGILDSATLAPLLTILKAHEFPPTALRFNLTSSLLVSGSPDNTVRVVTIPASLGSQSRSWILFFAVFFVLLAILFQIYGVPNELKAVFS
ncbi:WD40 repeat-like protein [Thelephora terrestris]|uniref:WD40 repeat-like protein n=1 Tax=Thelephora terrestris TaxID=56493 RepID=A0A9P6H666_9AGAM|nr:WD40 repeat-like protein [Thelephora terrestris]